MVTNYEKFKDILANEILAHGAMLAVKHGKPLSCNAVDCEICELRTARSCADGRVNWLNSEYTEQPKLTKQEMAFLVALDPSFQYVARDKKGHLSFFRIKPEKNLFLEKWDIPNRKCEEQRLFYSVPTCLSFMEEQRIFSFRFDFIIWEDDDPWSVKNLLRLEVIDDDN